MQRADGKEHNIALQAEELYLGLKVLPEWHRYTALQENVDPLEKRHSQGVCRQ